MKLTIVGCSGTLPGPSSPASAYLFEADGFRLLVDCGNGAIGAVQRYAGLLDLDAVLISHAHTDHCIDLLSYSYARRYHPTAPLPRVPVYGPEGLQARLVRAFEQPPEDELEVVYEFRTVQTGRRTIGPFEVDLGRVNHPVETYGMRIMADGATVAYSADTGESDVLVDLARNADLFLCEASFLDGTNPKDLHLTARQAVEHAARANARRLVLTHLVPWNDEARTTAEAASVPYDGTIELARQGAAYELSVGSSDIP